MDRRRFIAGSVALLARPVVVEAQPSTKTPKLGYLFFGTAGSDPAAIEGFKQGLRGFGYIENQNIMIEYRYADGNPDRLPRLIAELTNLKIDVLVSQGTAATAAAKRGTTATPVVFVALDPLGSGLVHSLARPGGHITGLSFAQGENFTGKWLALVKDIAPKATRVGVIWNPANPANSRDVKELEALAPRLGLRLSSHRVRSLQDINGAFAAVTNGRVAGLIVETDPITIALREPIVRLAAANRLPTIYGVREFVDAGAIYVDKILRGNRPGDLPIEQSTTFELVINLKTAKALGLTIPPSLLLRADQLIE